MLPLLTAYAIALPVFEIFRGAVDWTDVLLTLYWGAWFLIMLGTIVMGVLMNRKNNSVLSHI